MGGVANTQQSRPRPVPQTINLYCEEAHVVPVAQSGDAIAEERLEARNVFAKFFDAAFTKLVGCTFWNHQCALPIFFAVDHDEDFSGFHMPQRFSGVAGMTADPHPKNVHGSP